MANFNERIYNSLKRKGLAPKFERAGIYMIKIGNRIAYIGKSENMLKRMSEHYAAIAKQSGRKYRILAEANRRGYKIMFSVMYYAKSTDKNALAEEIG